MMVALVGRDDDVEKGSKTGDQRETALREDSEISLSDLVVVADLVREIRTALGP